MGNSPKKTATTSLLPCYHYNKGSCKQGKSCPYIHVCRRYVEGKCSRCEKTHDISNKCITSQLKRHGIKVIKKEKDKYLADLKAAFCSSQESEGQPSLVPCYFYNKTACPKGEMCPYLHICSRGLVNKCGKDCDRNHDISNECVSVQCDRFGINTDNVHKIMADLKVSNNKGIGGQPSLMPCYYYNTGVCPKGKMCPYFHMCRSGLVSKCGDNCDRNHDISNECVSFQCDRLGINTDNVQNIMTDMKAAVYDNLGRGESAVCHFNIAYGSCSWGSSCCNVHSDLPYQWRWTFVPDKTWHTVSIAKNQRIEKTYCDPANEDLKFNIGQGIVVHVNLESMKGRDKKGYNYEVQRLSTSSSVQSDNKPLTTVWKWYWKDKDGRIKEYGNDKGTNGAHADITSAWIEQKYINNPEGRCSFTTSDFVYAIDFKKMEQRNTETSIGTTRRIYRRPSFLSHRDVKNQKTQLKSEISNKSELIKAPADWTMSTGERILDHCKRVELSHLCEEYEEISSMFHATLSSQFQITSIMKIQNGRLWWDYESKRKRMLQQKKDESMLGERKLFHGTQSQYVDPIWRQGFDFRLSGQTTGTLYGKGAYFAKTAEYSDDYAESESDRFMFVARVLAGECVRGKPDYKRPPHKNKKDMSSDLYDSCVDNMNNPTIFVIFDNNQIYPEYLICYRDTDW